MKEIMDVNETMGLIRSMKRKELINVFQTNRANSAEHWMYFSNFSKKNKIELRGMLTDIYFKSVPIYLPNRG